jgi:hypothetical protein
MTAFPRTGVLISAAAAIAALMFLPIRSDAINRVSLPTWNMSSYKAWVTIQNDIRTRNLDYGWVEAGKIRKWDSGFYMTGSYYYVRFEFFDKDGKKICDTKARTYAPYTAVSDMNTVYGNYKDGHCWIDAYDQPIPN